MAKKYHKPWEVPGVPWKTESAFWVWVRGVLRKGWSRHPVKIEYIKANRMRIPNPKPSKRFPEIWGMKCEICRECVPQNDIEIDHISDTGGTFKGIEDFKDYAAYLFLVDFSCLRSLCKPCHKIVSYSQREGISFNEAKAIKTTIAFMKKPKQEQLDFLQQRGYNSDLVSTDKKRRKLLEEIFKEE